MTAPRRARTSDEACPEPSEPGGDLLKLIRGFAQGLPEALDDEMAARLAARVRPFLLTSAAGPEAPTDHLLTVAEAASRAHVHIETIRRAIRDGRLAIGGCEAEQDFAGWLAILVKVATQLDSTDALNARCPGSWEAQLVQHFTKGAAGWRDELVAEFKDRPA